MSKSVTANIKCPGCNLSTTVGFRPPALFRPSIFQFTCSGCTSLVMAKIETTKFKKGEPLPEKGQVRVGVKMIKASNMLIQMLKEEAEHNAAPAAE
jgi:hypothetical protein